MPSFRKRHREPDDTPMPPPVEQRDDSPVVQTAQAEIQKRLAEQRHAEQVAQQPAEPKIMAAEPQQQSPQLPDDVREWLAVHPEFTRDRRQNLRLQLAHEEAAEAGINVGHADYLAALEERLGLRAPPSPPATQHHDDPRGGDHYVSAPVSRDLPSMGGGRRASESSKLTGEETAMARSLGLTAQQYLEQKTKMNRLKVSGAIQQ